MNEYRYPVLRKTEQYLRQLGYDERSIRDITAASRREMVRFAVLQRIFEGGEGGGKRGGGSGGVYDML